MHKLYVVISINIIALSIVVLLLSLLVIHSAELSIISSSFLLLGIVMLPIGLGLESSAERLLRLKAKGYDSLMHRILEEFLVFDKKPLFCPASKCKVSSIIIPIGKSNIRVNKVSNRLITLLDDTIALMLEVPGISDLRGLIRKSNDITEINENINDIVSSTLMLSSSTRVSLRGDEYIVTINDVRGDVIRELGPYNTLILLVGGILSEQLGKRLLLTSYDIAGKNISLAFKEA